MSSNITNGHMNGNGEVPVSNGRNGETVLGETARRLLAQQELRAELDGTALGQQLHGALKETEENIEEIKSLDSQINRLNVFMDRFEKQNDRLNEKLKDMLESQKQARLEQSQFKQREKEFQAEQSDFHSQVAQVLAASRQQRTDPPQAGVETITESVRTMKTTY